MRPHRYVASHGGEREPWACTLALVATLVILAVALAS